MKFGAFYSTKPSGLGLGLSICRSIIEAHGGRLWASANLPRGASFNSPCRRSQILRRDAALVSRPEEQATRPRVLLWDKSRRRTSRSNCPPRRKPILPQVSRVAPKSAKPYRPQPASYARANPVSQPFSSPRTAAPNRGSPHWPSRRRRSLHPSPISFLRPPH